MSSTRTKTGRREENDEIDDVEEETAESSYWATNDETDEVETQKSRHRRPAANRRDDWRHRVFFEVCVTTRRVVPRWRLSTFGSAFQFRGEVSPF